MGSENRVVPIEKAGSLKRSARPWPDAGRSTWKNGRLLKNWQVKGEVGGRHPYAPGSRSQRRSLQAQPWQDAKSMGELDLLQHQTAFGLTARISIW